MEALEKQERQRRKRRAKKSSDSVSMDTLTETSALITTSESSDEVRDVENFREYKRKNQASCITIVKGKFNFIGKTHFNCTIRSVV